MHARGNVLIRQPAMGASVAPCSLARRPSRAVVKAYASSNCPYSTLGVAPNANDTEIKQAYRKLVLQYHPDVCQTSGAERKFMSIQQAYELLTGKSRGGDGRSGGMGDQAFNEWYWSFMQKRRWGGYKKGSAAAAASSQASADPSAASFHQQPEHKSAVRSQLAGLRHRAAIRANRKGPRWTAAAAAEQPAQGDAQQQEQPEALASLEYDSTEMSDGCNMSSGITDWEAAAAEHAAAAAKRRFSATESHKQQVMSQVANLHRMAAAAQDAGGLW